MFDFIHNNKSVQLAMKLLLGAVAVSFIIFGATDFTSLGAGSGEVAEVGGTPISKMELERELQFRNAGPDQAEAVTAELIQRQLLLEKAKSIGLVVTKEELRDSLSAIPVFQKDGAFSPDLYREFLDNRRVTAEEFERMHERDLLIQKLAGQYLETSFVSKAARERLATFLSTRREVSTARVDASAFLDKVQVTDRDVEAYYKSHAAEFQLPEQVRLEYIVLSLPALATSQTVSDEEVKQVFESNRSRYESEERQASHILFTVPEKADASARQAAKAQAEKVLQEARANPAQFAALATKHSQDPVSAAQGGDLGWARKEAYDPKFGEALFKMQPQQISDLVESSYGYHIIQLNGIKRIGLAESKPEIVKALQEQKARKALPEMTEKMSDLVVDNEKNLAPVAQALKVPLQTSGWVTRTGLPDDPLLSQKDVLEKVFTVQSLGGSATDVIELPNQERAVFRVAQRQPARLQALSEVAPAIRSKLQQQAATKLAVAEGQRVLAALNKGEAVALQWSGPEMISRQQPGKLSKDSVKQIMELNGPLHTGAAEGNGFAIFKVGPRVTPPVDPMILQGLQQGHVDSEAKTLLKSLESQIKVSRLENPNKAAAE